jgi:hypothetical protein
MGVDPDALRGLYPEKDDRELYLRLVRGLFTGGSVSYEEAGDLLRLGENPDGNIGDDGALRNGNIFDGLRNVKETSVADRQEMRAALFAAAAAGVDA